MKAVGIINDSLYDFVSGKILFFSLQDFEQKIVKEARCFICGADREEKEFNEEHIIPHWLLKRHNLFSSTITLPNQTPFKYGSYTTPCCKECNSFLGASIEVPVSDAFALGAEGFNKWVADGNHMLLFIWMSLIFIKTHLKDLQLRMSRDLRLSAEKIGDNYYWETMHHIHCIARSLFTGAIIDTKVIGSLVVLPVKNDDMDFDYRDHFLSKTLMIKSNDICIMTTLNDSCAGINVLWNLLMQISSPLNLFQYRELFAKFVDVNLILKNRPIYSSKFENNEYRIVAELPQKIALSQDTANYGEILFWALKDVMDENDPNFDYVKKHILEGVMSYLVDEKGQFKPDI
ncbi:HNH endonuclease [Pedobacter sp. SG908]|uniref:HNH endonuclease n=1 Tax=Pedobacter sp. SG908 TaxID=2587135 RepID=UPI0014236A3E|nr:HNH endonuclease [Pedobacter sp. SG908]NII83118.1 hypothetical protein [Pedobacter sp. SG908]